MRSNAAAGGQAGPVIQQPGQNGPSKSKKAIEAVKSTRIETVFFVQKLIQLMLAFIMLVFSVIRIGFMEDFETVTGFMISFYLVLFAIMFICVECNLKKSRLWFYFLNSSLGKGLFHMFCFLLCFGSASDPSWVDVLLGVIFFLTSLIMFVMYCFFKNQEGAYID